MPAETTAPDVEAATARGYRAVQAPACARVRRAYVPRQPEQTVLHGVIREHLETFLAEARQRGGGDGLSIADCRLRIADYLPREESRLHVGGIASDDEG